MPLESRGESGELSESVTPEHRTDRKFVYTVGEFMHTEQWDVHHAVVSRRLGTLEWNTHLVVEKTTLLCMRHRLFLVRLLNLLSRTGAIILRGSPETALDRVW